MSFVSTATSCLAASTFFGSNSKAPLAYLPSGSPAFGKGVVAFSNHLPPRTRANTAFKPLSMRGFGPDNDSQPTRLDKIFGKLLGPNKGKLREKNTEVKDAGGPSAPPPLNGLTPEAIEALLNASSSLFSVDVLEKDGKTVVLLGESHVKLPISARAGKEVLEHFPVRVLEGAAPPGDVDKKNLGGLWGGYFKFLHNVKEMTNGALEGSTIYVAADQKGINAHGQLIVNKPMEEGHVPSIHEAVTFDMLPMYLSLSIMVENAHHFKDMLPPNVLATVETVRVLLGYQSTLSVIDTLSGGRFSDHKLGSLINPMSGILHGRSKTMARNIGQVVDENQDETTPTLAIMGAAHVHKVIQDLSEKHGFKRVFLPGQHTGEGLIGDMARKAQSDIRLVEKIANEFYRNKDEPLN